MIYKNSKLPFFLSLLCILVVQNLQSQVPDTSFTVPNSVLLSKLRTLNDLNTSIVLSKESDIIPLQHTFLAPNAQKLIKHGTDIYVLIEQTGFVFKLMNKDSVNCVFKRIDHTVNLNYNIDCKNFFYKGQLFSYGGYGFWKSNGHLRKFNFEDSEWDIIPLSEEVMSSNFTWYDEKAEKLYVPIQRVINAGVAGVENVKGVSILKSYYLDLDQKKWIQLGDLNAEVASKMESDINSVGFLSFSGGLIHLIHDEAYIFDFAQNRIFKSRNADLNQFLIRRSNMTNMFLYNGFIYSYIESSKSFITYPFKMSDFELLKTGIWGTEKKIFYIVILLIVFVLMIVLLTWLINRVVKRKIEAAQLKILKSKTSNQAFSATEVALIQLLLSATLKETTVEIHQINHVLGIKDKNIGLQKKVRSDVMNAINDKFEFIAYSSSLLIVSSRKEDDKRYYEYFINPTEVKAIQRILENN
jgi:hypothetical protein